MRSSVITVRASDIDALTPRNGYVLATRINLPLPPDTVSDLERHVLHVQPGVSVTTDIATAEALDVICAVQVIVDGSAFDWQPAQVAAVWPNGSKYVLEAEWTDSNGEHQRTKIIEVPEGITPTATNIVGHEWEGDA